MKIRVVVVVVVVKENESGIPGWRSGLAPAFGPGHDPGDPGSNPTSGSRCMEPDMGLDPGTPESHSGLKAALNPASCE